MKILKKIKFQPPRFLANFLNKFHFFIFQLKDFMLSNDCIERENVILIVEFATHLREKEGLSVFESAVRAAKLRSRPIVMISLVFSFGVLPLALSSGAGALGRHSIGTRVIGGILPRHF